MPCKTLSLKYFYDEGVEGSGHFTSQPLYLNYKLKNLKKGIFDFMVFILFVLKDTFTSIIVIVEMCFPTSTLIISHAYK